MMSSFLNFELLIYFTVQIYDYVSYFKPFFGFQKKDLKSTI